MIVSVNTKIFTIFTVFLIIASSILTILINQQSLSARRSNQDILSSFNEKKVNIVPNYSSDEYFRLKVTAFSDYKINAPDLLLQVNGIETFSHTIDSHFYQDFYYILPVYAGYSDIYELILSDNYDKDKNVFVENIVLEKVNFDNSIQIIRNFDPNDIENPHIYFDRSNKFLNGFISSMYSEGNFGSYSDNIGSMKSGDMYWNGAIRFTRQDKFLYDDLVTVNSAGFSYYGISPQLSLYKNSKFLWTNEISDISYREYVFPIRYTDMIDNYTKIDLVFDNDTIYQDKIGIANRAVFVRSINTFRDNQSKRYEIDLLNLDTSKYIVYDRANREDGSLYPEIDDDFGTFFDGKGQLSNNSNMYWNGSIRFCQRGFVLIHNNTLCGPMYYY